MYIEIIFVSFQNVSSDALCDIDVDCISKLWIGQGTSLPLSVYVKKKSSKGEIYFVSTQLRHHHDCK